MLGGFGEACASSERYGCERCWQLSDHCWPLTSGRCLQWTRVVVRPLRRECHCRRQQWSVCLVSGCSLADHWGGMWRERQIGDVELWRHNWRQTRLVRRETCLSAGSHRQRYDPGNECTSIPRHEADINGFYEKLPLTSYTRTIKHNRCNDCGCKYLE